MQGGEKANTGMKAGGVTKNGIAVKGLDGQAYMVDILHLQKIQLEAKKPETTNIPGCRLYMLDLQNVLAKHALMAQHAFNVDT